MNIHVPEEIQKLWPGYFFVGIPFECNGKRYMRAVHKTLDQTHFYDFEQNFFWHNRPEQGKPEYNSL
jgi:hypothetical protein